MNRQGSFLAVALLTLCTALNAQAPAGATGQCKDGTYSTAKAKSGACAGHKGVQSWFSTAAGSPPVVPAIAPSAPAVAAPTPTAAKPAPAVAPSQAIPPRQKAPSASLQPAASGGAGQVWVNTSTKVYHCSGDRFYGKTKNGAYMSESDALAKGARADAGKPCNK